MYYQNKKLHNKYVLLGVIDRSSSGTLNNLIKITKVLKNIQKNIINYVIKTRRMLIYRFAPLRIFLNFKNDLKYII